MLSLLLFFKTPLILSWTFRRPYLYVLSSHCLTYKITNPVFSDDFLLDHLFISLNLFFNSSSSNCELNTLQIIINFYSFSFPPNTLSELDLWTEIFSNKIFEAISSSSFFTEVKSCLCWWFPQLQDLKSLINKV